MADLTLEIRGAAELAAAFGQAPALVERESRIAMADSLRVTVAEINARTPVGDGNPHLWEGTKGRIEGSPASGFRGVIANPMAHAIPVERGTRPHVIRPRNKRVLSFEVNGRRYFAKEVRHPGTRGVFMFRDGLQAAAPRVQAFFARALALVMANIARGRAR